MELRLQFSKPSQSSCSADLSHQLPTGQIRAGYYRGLFVIVELGGEPKRILLVIIPTPMLLKLGFGCSKEADASAPEGKNELALMLKEPARAAQASAPALHYRQDRVRDFGGGPGGGSGVPVPVFRDIER